MHSTDQPPVSPPEESPEKLLTSERNELLLRLQTWLETPMLVLSFVWLALFVVELTWGLHPLLEITSHVIWAVFVIDFLLEFVIAPSKGEFVRSNWLQMVSLLLPALRIFRVLRVFRLGRVARYAGAARGLRLARVVSALNRGMRAFGGAMERRGMGYVVGLTLTVTLIGAAGMYAFERSNADGRGLPTYGAALWWTAMIMTTMGSDYWPQSSEGRVLCFLLSLYAFAVFGYVTAALATYFVGRDADDERAELPGGKQFDALRAEISALRDDIRRMQRGPATA
jgi:voltage-gated potassium channel